MMWAVLSSVRRCPRLAAASLSHKCVMPRSCSGGAGVPGSAGSAAWSRFSDMPSERARRHNWECRIQLATGYRALNYYGMNEGVCNHLSLIAPAADGSGNTVMLLLPYGHMWSEVTASTLVGVDESARIVEGDGGDGGDGGQEVEVETSAVTIHSGVHKSRPDALAVMHIHPPYTTALSCSKDPMLKMCHQNSTRFYANTAYDTCYSGISTAEEEGRRLGSVLGDKEVLVMANHGVLSAQPTASLAFDCLYYFERAAMFQVICESRAGSDVKVISDSLCQEAYDASLTWRQKYADSHYRALYNLLNKSKPHIDT